MTCSLSVSILLQIIISDMYISEPVWMSHWLFFLNKAISMLSHGLTLICLTGCCKNRTGAQQVPAPAGMAGKCSVSLRNSAHPWFASSCLSMRLFYPQIPLSLELTKSCTALSTSSLEMESITQGLEFQPEQSWFLIFDCWNLWPQCLISSGIPRCCLGRCARKCGEVLEVCKRNFSNCEVWQSQVRLLQSLKLGIEAELSRAEQEGRESFPSGL